jgi:hypothetical protein
MKTQSGLKRLAKKMVNFQDQMHVLLRIGLTTWKRSMRLRFLIEFIV